MNKIKSLLANRWVGFASASTLYVLWFVLWTERLWLLIGLIPIYDAYISKYMERYIFQPNKRLCQRNSIYNSIYEWVNALLFATVVATIIHTYIFQLYVIPTSSMEKTLLVGDYLYVSKVSYGPKMPNTPLSMPFVHHTMPLSSTKPSFSDAVKWPYHRLRGIKDIKRGDVVVFNFPAGDTVLLENQAVTYYDVLRGYESTFGKLEGRRRLFNDYTIVSRPIDKRENYIKRCVAIAGDTIKIVGSRLYVNGVEEAEIPERQYIYIVQTSSPISQHILRRLNITEALGNGSIYQMPLSIDKLEEIKKLPNVIEVTQYISEEVNGDIFPSSPLYPWGVDNIGDIWIPKAGVTIELNMENLPLYERVISLYEGAELDVKEGTIYINGQPTTEYTFQMDYFWMMGDNRHNSADSRFWGFVPEDHVVGKASFVWLSLDKELPFPQNIRWERLFRKVR